MELTWVILAAAALAALAAFVMSASRAIDADPVDPEAPKRALVHSLLRHPKLVRFLRQRFDRNAAGGLGLTVGFAVVIGTALLVGAGLDLIDESDEVARADAWVSRWGSRNADTTAVDVLEAVTHLGSTVGVVLAVIVVSFIDWRRFGRSQVPLFVGAVVAGQWLIVNTLKVAVDRERPSVLRLVSAHGPSFPSGHSAAAAAGWAAVALVLSRGLRRNGRAAVGAAAVFVAIAVAASRALLGVHWLTDVIVGVGVGWGWFVLVAVMFGGRLQRLGEPAEEAHAVQPEQHGADPVGADRSPDRGTVSR